MNQRFEDTYDKATDAICGMAKDYRLMDERNRLLNLRVREQTDEITDLRLKLDAPIDCENCPHQHPEYHEAKFTLIEPGRLIEHEESDIDLAIDKQLDRFVTAALYGNFFDVIMWRWVFNTVRL